MQQLNQIIHQLRNLISTTKALRIFDGGSKAQVKLSDTDFRQYPIVQPFGIASFAPDSSGALVIAENGETEQGGLVVLLHSTTGRPTIAQGETALHNKLGDFIWIKTDGSIEIKASAKVVVNAPTVEIAASSATIKASNITLDGNVSITKNLTVAAKASIGGVATAASVAAGSYSGTAGGAVKSNSDIETTGTIKADSDIQASGISLKSHTHTDAEGRSTSSSQ